jgi:molecular chaperone DnaK
MKAEEGNIIWVNHGGDNWLGGSKIDWAIVEQLIIPELVDNYDLPDFSRGNSKWQSALARIKHKTEDAKILLSRIDKDKTIIEIKGIKDAHGEKFDHDFILTRDAMISVAEPFIMSSVEICKRVMKEKNLSPNAIERMILVGGPTKAPYFREILHSSLGIQIDHRVDPLTVVARGAAVFAGTQRIDGKAAPKAVAGQFNVSLVYKTMGPDRDPQIMGAVKSLDNSSVEGFTVEFVNRTDGAKDLLGWRSGKIPLKADGKFKLRLAAEKGVRNNYLIELLDFHGSMRIIVPDTVVYTVTGGAGVISEQPLNNSIAVALANNERDIFFNKGGSLPAKKTKVLRTAHTLHKGESGEILKVPVVEGEMEKADHNRLLGTLEIKGAKIRRDLPAGTEVEVSLILDASKILTAKAYVPMLDEEFEAVIEHAKRSPEYPELKKQFEQEVHRHKEMVGKANETDSKSLAILVEDIDESGKFEEIEKLLHAGRADCGAALEAEKRLLDLRVNLDKADDLLKWPALVTEANQGIDDLDKLIEEHGVPEQQKRADKLREQMEELVLQERAAPLRKKIKQIIDLRYEILFAQPSFWVGYFKYLEKQRSKIPDAGAADRLFNQGYQCIQKENISGLRNVIVQLNNLLPDEVVEEVKRGYESGLLN